MNIQEKFYDYIEKNDIENVKLILEDKNFDPSANVNWAVFLAYEKNFNNIVILLCKDKRVMKNLHFENPKLYRELTKIQIKEKIDCF